MKSSWRGAQTVKSRRPAKARALQFVVSNMMIQLMTGDPSLRLTAAGFVRHKSGRALPDTASEVLFQKFISYLNGIASREYESTQAAKLSSPNTPSN
jgi:hypothetical protein